MSRDLPRVDDHLVEPETTRDQMIGGRLVRKMPADRPHAERASRLDYVLSAKVRPGYGTASDLLTRVDLDSDFASDAAVLKHGIDPATGARFLEELAFEIVSGAGRKEITEKAVRMSRRGLRRLFAVFLRKEQVCEWSSEAGAWKPLDPASSIEDPVLIEPLEVAALLDAAVADDAVVSALNAKGNRKLEQLKADSRIEGKTQGRAEGKAEGKAEAILSFLEARGLEPSDALRGRILACADPEILQRWLRRAATASSADEVLEGR